MIRKMTIALVLFLMPAQFLFAQISSRYIIDYSESGETLFFTDVGKNKIDIFVNEASSDEDFMFFISRYANNDTLHFFVNNASFDTRAFYSYDKTRWFPIENRNIEGQSLHLQNLFSKERVWISLRPPKEYNGPGLPIIEKPQSHPAYYTLDKIVNYVNSVSSHPFVELVTLGQSIQGRDIFMMTITDTSVPDSEKKSVWLQFRVHGNEMEQSYIFEGLVNYLLAADSTSIARQALKRIIFKLIPAINPDGIVNRTRGNSNGVDMNRVWVDSTNHEAEEPEVRLVHDALDGWILNQGNKVHFAIDKHGWGSGRDGGYRTLESVAGKAYVSDQTTFLRYMVLHDHWQRMSDWSFSSGAWGMFRLALHRQHALNVLTWETTSGTRYDGSETIIPDLKDEGAALVKAIYRYLFHVYFVDGQKNEVISYSAADSVFIRLEEADAIHQVEPEKCSVILYSSLNDTETVALQKTFQEVGVYYNDIGLPLSATSPVPEDGVLQVEPGKTIQVCYQDPDFPDDFCSQEILISPSSNIAEKSDASNIETYRLFQNYPNPFNAGTNIQIYIPSKLQEAQVELKIINILGEEVKTLINEDLPAGQHSFHWNGTDELGNVVSNGIYFFRLECGSFNTMKKLLFVK